MIEGVPLALSKIPQADSELSETAAVSSNALSQSISYCRNVRVSYSARVLSGVMAAIDAMCVFALGTALYISLIGWDVGTYSTYLSGSVIGSLLLIGTLNQVGHYTPHFGNDLLRQAKEITSTWVVVFLVLVFAAYVLKMSSAVSRVWSFAWFGSALVLILLQRVLLWQLVLRAARQGRLVQRTAILGASDQGKRLLKHLEQSAEPWVTVTGFFDDRLARLGPEVMGYPLLGNVTDLMRFVSEHQIDSVLIALPSEAEQRISQLTCRLKELSIDAYLVPDFVGRGESDQEFKFIARAPMLRVASRSLDGWRRFLKEAEDRLLAIPLLLLLTPLLLIIAFAIKLDSKGPVFYRQERRGYNKKSFEILKFRTMYDDECRERTFQQAQRHDPRVTRVGRLLRRTSLDELPQLINVLKGDMSHVGPRPHPIALDERYAPYIPAYFLRNRIKPGITGWAQVNGFRGETTTLETMEKRIAHDIYYIENWSLTLDIRILIMTAFVGFIHKNAY